MNKVIRVKIEGIVQKPERTKGDEFTFNLVREDGKSRNVFLRDFMQKGAEDCILPGRRITAYGVECTNGIEAKQVIIHRTGTNFESVGSPMAMYW